MSTDHEISFEYRLFILACAMSVIVSFVFFVIGTFISNELDSSLIGLISMAVFSTFYFLAKKRQIFSPLLTPFLIILLVLINAFWLTAGGLNISNAFLFLIFFVLIIVIAPAAKRIFFIAAVFLNLALFILLEFLHPFYSMPIIKNDQLLVESAMVMLSVFGIIAYVMLFFKNPYDKERDLLRQQNIELDGSYSEIEALNEELIQYQEEIMAQRDFIEEKSKKLEEQAIELERANDNIKGINALLENIVEERTKELVDLNNDLDLLVYRSSHDFRRPLTTLMGLNEVARLTVKDIATKELFNRVNQTALHMDKMLLKFFMLYNINHFRTIQVRNSLEEIVENIYSKIISKKKHVLFNYKLDTKSYPAKDERNNLVAIIIENLVENSLIYNTKDQLELDLKIHEKDGDLYIILHDNGNGIPDAYHSKVFEMYFRGSTLSIGNGLGLYVVKRAAKLLKATVRLDSEEGKFTSFEIAFKV
jgi:signal transduction histidine kinase